MQILSKDVKLGNKYKIITDRLANQGYYDYIKGTEVTVTYRSGAAINVSSKNANRHVAVLVTDLGHLALDKISLEKELHRLDAEKEEIQNKIDWINETGSEEYDETQVKVWITLKTLENKKLTPLEKSKLIAKLIKEG